MPAKASIALHIPGWGLDLPFRKLPNFSPALTDTV